MNANGSNQTILTSHDSSDKDPAWSPNGTRIVFSRGRFDDSKIYIMNADCSNQIRLTLNGVEDSSPA